MLLHTPLEAYGREEPWYVYDTTLQPHWLPEGTTLAYLEP